MLRQWFNELLCWWFDHRWSDYRPVNPLRVLRMPDTPYMECRYCYRCGISDDLRIHDFENVMKRNFDATT